MSTLLLLRRVDGVQRLVLHFRVRAVVAVVVVAAVTGGAICGLRNLCLLLPSLLAALRGPALVESVDSSSPCATFLAKVRSEDGKQQTRKLLKQIPRCLSRRTIVVLGSQIDLAEFTQHRCK